MMVPAEYSTVKFETRMASYSDDEHNAHLHETEALKQKCRGSMDFAVKFEGRGNGTPNLLIGGVGTTANILTPTLGLEVA